MGLANTNITVDGNTDFRYRGGSGSFFVQGTPDSATAKLQFSVDGVTYTDVASASRTTAGETRINVAPCFMRLNVDGGGTALDLNVMVKEDGQMK